jgi:DNA-binding transcriptional ArsR family regulator
MFVIRELRQIRALGSPARQAIVDALESMGPCSAFELGEVLGRTSDRLYYHLQILKKAGVVRSRRERNRAGRLQERFDLPGRPTRLRYIPSDSKNVAAITKLVGSALREAHRAFGKAFTQDAVVQGGGRTLWAGRRTGWLAVREVRQLNVLLHQIIGILERPRHGRRSARLYSFTFAFSPYGRSPSGTGERNARTPRRARAGPR